MCAPMVRLSSMRLLFSCLLVALFATLPSAAKPAPVAGEGCQFDLPDDWKTDTSGGFALVATAPDGKGMLTLRVLPNRNQAKIDESFYLEAMKRARQQKSDADQGSLVIIEAGTASINGVPASYIHTEEAMPEGKTDYGRGYLIAANDKFYSISTDTADPFMDKQMNDIVGTFHFDRAPVLPEIERPFYRRLAQVGGVAACVLFLVGFFVWLAARRSKQPI